MRRRPLLLSLTTTAIGLIAAACGSTAAPASPPTSTSVATGTLSPVNTASAAPAAPTIAPTATVAVAPTEPPTVTASFTAGAAAATTTTPNAASTPTGSASVAASSTDTIRYAVVPNGSQAQFQAREQLAGRSLPSDAIGTTTGVTGALVLRPDGQVVSNQSKIVVDLSTMASDQSRRDGYIKRTTLDVAQFPNATFVPTSIVGLPTPLPTSGQHIFQMVGNLTIRDVTKPKTWNVTAQANDNDVTGQATTSFAFEDFGMTPPKAGPVLSVDDTVKLVVTLHLARSA